MFQTRRLHRRMAAGKPCFPGYRIGSVTGRSQYLTFRSWRWRVDGKREHGKQAEKWRLGGFAKERNDRCADSEERLGDWDGHSGVFAPLCSPRRAARSSGVWGYSTRCLWAAAPRGGVSRQGVVLTGFQSLVDCS